MKINGKNFEELKENVTSFCTMFKPEIEVFKCKLEQNPKIKVVNRALLWEILFHCSKTFSEDLRTFKNDCTDANLETAMVKILKDIYPSFNLKGIN